MEKACRLHPSGKCPVHIHIGMERIVSSAVAATEHPCTYKASCLIRLQNYSRLFH